MKIGTLLDLLEIFLKEEMNRKDVNPYFMDEVVKPVKALYDKIREWEE